MAAAAIPGCCVCLNADVWYRILRRGAANLVGGKAGAGSAARIPDTLQGIRSRGGKCRALGVLMGWLWRPTGFARRFHVHHALSSELISPDWDSPRAHMRRILRVSEEERSEKGGNKESRNEVPQAVRQMELSPEFHERRTTSSKPSSMTSDPLRISSSAAGASAGRGQVGL